MSRLAVDGRAAVRYASIEWVASHVKAMFEFMIYFTAIISIIC